MLSVSELPFGVFRSLLELWSVMCDTFVSVYDWMLSYAVDIGGVSYSLITVMLGIGVTVYLTYAFLKWLV